MTNGRWRSICAFDTFAVSLQIPEIIESRSTDSISHA